MLGLARRGELSHSKEDENRRGTFILDVCSEGAPGSSIHVWVAGEVMPV